MAKEPPPLSGFLHKRGGGGVFGSAYKKRWFESATNRLYYYKNRGEACPIADICLDDVVEIRPSQSDKRNGDCAFELVSDARTYYLLAPSPADMQRWMLHLTQMKEYHSQDTDATTRSRKKALDTYNQLMEIPPDRLTPSQRTQLDKVRLIIDPDSFGGSGGSYMLPPVSNPALNSGPPRPTPRETHDPTVMTYIRQSDSDDEDAPVPPKRRDRYEAYGEPPLAKKQEVGRVSPNPSELDLIGATYVGGSGSGDANPFLPADLDLDSGDGGGAAHGGGGIDMGIDDVDASDMPSTPKEAVIEDSPPVAATGRVRVNQETIRPKKDGSGAGGKKKVPQQTLTRDQVRAARRAARGSGPPASPKSGAFPEISPTKDDGSNSSPPTKTTANAAAAAKEGGKAKNKQVSGVGDEAVPRHSLLNAQANLASFSLSLSDSEDGGDGSGGGGKQNENNNKPSGSDNSPDTPTAATPKAGNDKASKGGESSPRTSGKGSGGDNTPSTQRKRELPPTKPPSDVSEDVDPELPPRPRRLSTAPKERDPSARETLAVANDAHVAIGSDDEDADTPASKSVADVARKQDKAERKYSSRVGGETHLEAVPAASKDKKGVRFAVDSQDKPVSVKEPARRIVRRSRPTMDETARSNLRGFRNRRKTEKTPLALADISNEKRTPLLNSALIGDLTAIETLVRGVPDGMRLAVDRTDINALTALHLAAMKKHAAVVRALAFAGQPVNAVCNFTEETPLHMAARLPGAYVEVATTLIQTGADPTIRNAAGLTPEMVGREAGHNQVPSMLRVQVQPNVAASPIEVPAAADSALIAACRNAEHNNYLAALLELGSDPNEDCDASFYKFPPLHVAAVAGNVVACELLLQHSAAVDAVDAVGGTALHAALRFSVGSVSVVTCLLEGGCDVNATNNCGRTPLMLACDWGSVDCAIELLNAGADVRADSAVGGALHAVARNGYTELCKMLIEEGADIGGMDEGGRTPLHLACFWGHKDCVTALLAAGASFLCEDENGWTAQDAAEDWDAYTLHSIMGGMHTIPRGELSDETLVDESLESEGFQALEDFLLDWVTETLSLPSPLVALSGPGSAFSSGELFSRLYNSFRPGDPRPTASFSAYSNVTSILRTFERAGVVPLHPSHRWDAELICSGDLRATVMLLIALCLWSNDPNAALIPPSVSYEVVVRGQVEKRWFTFSKDTMSAPVAVLELRAQGLSRHSMKLGAEELFVGRSKEKLNELADDGVHVLIVDSDDLVSSVHFVIKFNAVHRQFVVQDLGSRNGTTVAVRAPRMCDRIHLDVIGVTAITTHAVIRAGSCEVIVKELHGVHTPQVEPFGQFMVPRFVPGVVLQVVTGPSAGNAQYVPASARCVLGRKQATDPVVEGYDVLWLADPERNMSRKHAEMGYSAKLGCFTIKDLSACGTCICREHNVPVSDSIDWTAVAWEPLRKGEISGVRAGGGLRLGPNIALRLMPDGGWTETGPTVRAAASLALRLQTVLDCPEVDTTDDQRDTRYAAEVVSSLPPHLASRIVCAAVGLPSVLSLREERWMECVMASRHNPWAKVVSMKCLELDMGDDELLCVTLRLKDYLTTLVAKLVYSARSLGNDFEVMDSLWSRDKSEKSARIRSDFAFALKSTARTRGLLTSSLPAPSVIDLLKAGADSWAAMRAK